MPGTKRSRDERTEQNIAIVPQLRKKNPDLTHCFAHRLT